MPVAGARVRRAEENITRAVDRAPIGDAAPLLRWPRRYRRSSPSAIQPPRPQGIRQVHNRAGILLLARELKRLRPRFHRLELHLDGREPCLDRVHERVARGCSSPRPSRPRWRSAGRRRSTTHPSSGRSAAEDGGGLSCLARNGRSPGEESRIRRRCGQAIEAQPSFGRIKP